MTDLPLREKLEHLVERWRSTAVLNQLKQAKADTEMAARLGHRVEVYERCASQLSALLSEDTK